MTTVIHNVTREVGHATRVTCRYSYTCRYSVSRVDTFTREDSVVTVYVQVKHVSCTADNGVGEAAEAAKVVTVRRPPVLTAPMLTSVTVDNMDTA